ncbi:MAG: DUF2304 domain-containing protein [Eggerthellaceae bacterium]|jgi:hypothetical protein|nr:DUF2304 domain-containing protein [Eggerthellaceae bacterium]MCH4221332.1 DUF2304 domain-containing protein [Eggerthellaceae bacterium]
MTIALQIILIVAAIGLVYFVARGIRKFKMRIEDSLFWIFLSALILILSIFPQIATACADIAGFQAPVNFIFLFFIFVLLLKCFYTSRHTSQLENKVKELAQQVALDRLDHYQRKESLATDPSHVDDPSAQTDQSHQQTADEKRSEDPSTGEQQNSSASSYSTSSSDCR